MLINPSKMKTLKLTTLLLFTIFYSQAQVDFGIELGGGMGNTIVTNPKEYPNMFKNAAANGSAYSMANMHFRFTPRFSFKLGVGVKGQPYQFSVDQDYGVDEIADNFENELSKIALSYYMPGTFQFKLLKKPASPFIGLGYSYESLFKDLRFDGVSVPDDFQYIARSLHLVDFQFGYVFSKGDKPVIEVVFAYELGLNNLATDSYSFAGDDFKIRENDFEFGVNWYYK